MLTTRLWMGSVLIVLTVGMLFADQHLTWFPFLFLFQFALTLFACHELLSLLGPSRSPQKLMCYLGVITFVIANWLVNLPFSHDSSWTLLLAFLTGFLLGIFLYEMAIFTEPNRSVERMAITWLIIGYLGFLPCFFAQIRWISDDHQANSFRLALAAFVPKCCDIGAYFVGRLFGTHRMTPVLSPKKTWEGAAGGMAVAAAAAILIDRLGPATILGHNLLWEVSFGVTVGLAGMLGDLAESLLKRDCLSKDASAAVPGFGGVLDVVDAILFSAPVSYLWLYLLKPL